MEGARSRAEWLASSEARSRAQRMLNVVALSEQAPGDVVSLRFHSAGDDSNSPARCVTAALQSRASASVEGGRWVALACAPALIAQRVNPAKHRKAFIQSVREEFVDADRSTV